MAETGRRLRALHEFEALIGQGRPWAACYRAFESRVWARRVALKVIAEAAAPRRCQRAARGVRAPRCGGLRPSETRSAIFDVGRARGRRPYIVHGGWSRGRTLPPGWAGEAALARFGCARGAGSRARRGRCAWRAAHQRGAWFTATSSPRMLMMVRDDGMVKVLDFGHRPGGTGGAAEPRSATQAWPCRTLTVEGRQARHARVHGAPSRFRGDELDGPATPTSSPGASLAYELLRGASFLGGGAGRRASRWVAVRCSPIPWTGRGARTSRAVLAPRLGRGRVARARESEPEGAPSLDGRASSGRSSPPSAARSLLRAGRRPNRPGEAPRWRSSFSTSESARGAR